MGENKIIQARQQNNSSNLVKEEESLTITQKQYYSQLEVQDIEQLDFNKKSENFHAFLNFMSSMIGTGVLAIPFGMYQSGYVLGTIILIILGYFSYQSIKCLLEIVDHRAESIRIKSNSDFQQVLKAQNIHYQELILDILGYNMMQFGEFCLVVYQVGACISYIIFFSQFLNEAARYSGYEIHVFINIVITLIILTPFMLIDNIHHLSNLGLYCLLSFLFCAVVMFYHAFNIFANPSQIIYFDRLCSFQGAGSFIGVATYAFEGVGLVFHIKKSMKKRNDFNQILFFTMLICAIIYITFGAVGVLAYGPKLNQIILMNIPYNGWVSTFCKVGYALGKLLCIPLIVFPCYEIIQKYFCPSLIQDHSQQQDQLNQNQNINQSSQVSNYIFRVIILVIMTFIAFVIPQFSYFLNLIGGMSGLAIQFVIPSMLYLNYFFSEQSNQDAHKRLCTKIYHYLVIVFGSILSVYVTIESLIKLI